MAKGSGVNFGLGFNESEVTAAGAHSNVINPTATQGGGGSGVTSVTAGTGIGVTPTTGAVVVTNDGVLTIVAGTDITISGPSGNVTVNVNSAAFDAAGAAAAAQAAAEAASYPGLGKVPLSALANETASTLLGNPTGSAAAPQAIALGTNLSFSGSTLNAASGSGFPGYIRPEDHGAVANGTTDDTVAIMAAYNACTGGQALYLTGTYGIGTGATLNFNTVGTGIVSSPTASFNPSTAAPSANGCSFGTGSTLNYQSKCSLPNFNSFSGWAVKLKGANLLRLDVGEINGCGSGIVFDATGAAVLDNTVWVLNITSTTIAVSCLSDNAHVGQGNFVNTNFVNGCTSWVEFGSGGNQHSDNTFESDAVEIAGTTNPKIIYNNSGSAVNGNRFICRGFFGAGGSYTGTIFAIYNGATPSTSNNFQQCQFFFGNVAAAFPAYTAVENPEFNNDFTSKYEANFGGTPENVDGGSSPWLIAETAANNRANWPGTANFPAGLPVAFNRLPIACVLGAALGAGSSATFYAYSPFAQGHSRLGWSPANMHGAVVTALLDNYATNPNEILITVTNCTAANIALGTNLTGFLIVGIP